MLYKIAKLCAILKVLYTELMYSNIYFLSYKFYKNLFIQIYTDYRKSQVKDIKLLIH